MKCLLCILLLAATSLPIYSAEFELKDGDKVVWLGSTLIEREQRDGYWELELTALWPDRKFTFRNLGWSGDNVHGEARLGFDVNTPALGLKRMVNLTLAEKPTVIFICYGQNESFDGEAGLKKFEQGYEKLLDALKPAKARIVLMTVPLFEQLPNNGTGPANVRVQMYNNAIEVIAKKHECRFADFAKAWDAKRFAPHVLVKYTDNGMHLSEGGYYVSAAAVLNSIEIDTRKGQPADSGLRQAIIEKNKLYFYRWRPQNETYLFGFRKKEQGKNAAEIAEFDPLIEKAEAEIDRLKKPRTHEYKLVPVEKK